MLSKDGLRRVQGLPGCFHIAYDAPVNMWSLHHGHSLHNFPSCSPWTLAYRPPLSAWSCPPLAKEGSGAGAWKSHSWGSSSPSCSASCTVLLRQEALGLVPGSRELPVAYPAHWKLRWKLILFSIMFYHRIFNRVPALYSRTSSFIHSINSTLQSKTLCHPLPQPPHNHKSILCFYSLFHR